QFAALLSVGDRLAVDQTCVPVQGSPPCSDPNAVSQVFITHGSLSIMGNSCVGDCDASGLVTINELIRMVTISLESPTQDTSPCMAGDGNHDGKITVNEIIQAVNNDLSGTCPQI